MHCRLILYNAPICPIAPILPPSFGLYHTYTHAHNSFSSTSHSFRILHRYTEASNGMIDFAGSGIVHMVGGFAGLMGALVCMNCQCAVVYECEYLYVCIQSAGSCAIIIFVHKHVHEYAYLYIEPALPVLALVL